MGEFADKLKESNHSDQLVSAVGKAEDIAMVVSGAGAYYGTAKAIGAQLGLWGSEPDQFELLQAAIEEIKKAIDAAVFTLQEGAFKDRVLELEQLHLVLSQPSMNAMSLLRGTIDGSLTEDEIRVDLTMDTSPQHYLDGGAWTTISFSGAFHSDPWSGPLAPPLTDGDRLYMFSIVTPGYMNALARWVTAMAAVYTDPFRDNFEHEVSAHADHIVALYETWIKGIQRLRIPTIDELLPQVAPQPAWPQPGQHWSLKKAKWDQAERLWGAVDTFTPSASIASYEGDIPVPPDPTEYPFHYDGQPPPERGWTDRSPPPNPNSPNHPKLITDEYTKAYEAFRAKVAANDYPHIVLQLRAVGLREQKVIFNRSALPNMWRMQNALRTLMGATTIRQPNSPGHWSLREFDEVTKVGPATGSLDISDVAHAILGGNVVSMRALAERMRIFPINTISLRTIFHDPEHLVR